MREAAAATAAALEAVKRESAVRSADLADLRDRVGRQRGDGSRMAAATVRRRGAPARQREDDLRPGGAARADLLVELQHEGRGASRRGSGSPAPSGGDDQQAALAKMETRLHKAVGSLAAKAIWRWQNAVRESAAGTRGASARGRAALNGLLELQPPVLDAAVPA